VNGPDFSEPRFWIFSVADNPFGGWSETLANQLVSDPRLLFAEIKEGMHMAVVTTGAGRGRAKEVYHPQASAGFTARNT